MPARVRIAEILAAAQAACAPFGEQATGEVAVKVRGDWPRIVWALKGGTTAGARTPGSNEMGVDVWRLEVHAWGQDLAHALRLRAAALTALRQAAADNDETNRTRVGVSSTDIQGDEAVTTNGFVAITNLTIETPLDRVDLTKPEIEDAQGNLTGQASRFVYVGGAPGDRKLTARSEDEG